MAVADGHGGSRYWLSDVGSRLACELAIKIASKHLSHWAVASPAMNQLEAMHRWLADELPAELLTAWEEEIKADWEQRKPELPPEHLGESFSAQSYGSTLALVVVTPWWWAHTGLGDWDLVLLSNQEPDRIISQEADNTLHGEATESLCLPGASGRFAARTAVYPLGREQRQACGLVLTTDGIRKSCATDSDHLTLCRYLLEEAQLEQATTAGSTDRLDASLDRISREGSGDDVSVALACFGQLHLRPAAPSGQAAPSMPATHEPLPLQPAQTSGASIGTKITASPKITGTSRRQGPQGLILFAVIGVILAGGSGLWVLSWLPRTPSWKRAPEQAAETDQQQPALTSGQLQGMRQQIQRFCDQPTLIEPSLKSRNNQFKQLRNNPSGLKRVLDGKDWLGSVIGLSEPGGRGLGNLGACPKLVKSLSQHWQTSLSPQTIPAASHDGLRTRKDASSSPGAGGSHPWAPSRSPNR